MFSRPLAFVLLALGCLTAAAGGAYIATRHNTTDAVNAVAAPTPSVPQVPATAASDPATPTAQPVAETEAAVTAKKSEAAPAVVQPADAPAAPKRQDSRASKRADQTVRSACTHGSPERDRRALRIPGRRGGRSSAAGAGTRTSGGGPA
jgi:hypothetical protein